MTWLFSSLPSLSCQLCSTCAPLKKNEETSIDTHSLSFERTPVLKVFFIIIISHNLMSFPLQGWFYKQGPSGLKAWKRRWFSYNETGQCIEYRCAQTLIRLSFLSCDFSIFADIISLLIVNNLRTQMF